MSRTSIESLPTEACFEIAIIRQQCQKERITVAERFFSDFLFSDTTILTPANELMSILDKRSDIREKIVFNTDEGVLDLTEIERIINEKGKLLINLSADSRTERTYNIILLTELTRCFDFEYVLDEKSYNLDFYAVKRNERSESETINKYFPPDFFSEYKGKIENLFYVYMGFYPLPTINLHHRLSAFLINNAEELSQKADGVFRGFIRTLHFGQTYIELINRLISLLRNMRAVNKISCDIPDGLELTEGEIKEGYPLR